jgi:hypothetical protein
MNGVPLPEVSSYRYLGRLITPHREGNAENISKRICAAWAALRRIRPLLAHIKCRRVRFQLVNSMSLSALFFGLVSHTLTRAELRRVNGTHHRLLQAASNTTSAPLTFVMRPIPSSLYWEPPKAVYHASALLLARQASLLLHCLRRLTPLGILAAAYRPDQKLKPGGLEHTLVESCAKLLHTDVDALADLAKGSPTTDQVRDDEQKRVDAELDSQAEKRRVAKATRYELLLLETHATPPLTMTLM